MNKKEITINPKLFTYAPSRYSINTWKLTMYRESGKVSIEQFAKIAGWSPQYQYLLESTNKSPRTISGDLKNEILETFRRCSDIFHIFQITQVFTEHTRYEINTKLLKQLITAKMSRFLFARRMGWTIRYVRSITGGEIKEFSESTAKRIQSILEIE